MITIIAALDSKNGIGMKDGRIPWKQANDMQRFKSLTYGSQILCGRRTFETFPQPQGLPDRRHRVLTSDTSRANYTGVSFHRTVEHALTCVYQSDLWIVGGGEVYRDTLRYAHKLMLTRIHADTGCEVFFPEFDVNEWKKVASEHHSADALRNQYDYTFETYVRIE